MSLAAVGFALQLTACTSSDEKSDGEDVQQESIESLDGDTAAAPAAGGDEAMLSDSLPEDALGAESTTAEAPAQEPADAMASELDAADSMGASASADEPPPLVTDPGDDAMAMQPPPSEPAPEMPTPEPAAPESSSSMASNNMDSMSAPMEEAPKKPSLPLQKAASKPWKVGNDWFNGVYYARPGDTLKSISRSIYGKNRAALLKKGNPTYAHREPRPGDKVYYSSPKRPDDGEQMLSWFEDNGMQPQIYVAKAGDNIRTVSKTLLGYDGAWKETWSSNPMVDSKGELNEGTEIRYWASLPAPAMSAETQVAANDQGAAAPPPAEMPPPPPMDQANNALPPPSDMPPPPDMAMNNMPEPPPAGGMNDLPPPPPLPDMPPPPQAMNDIPPPPPPLDHAAAGSVKAGDEEAAAADQDTMMALGAVAIAAAGIAALLVVRRRRRQKDLEMHIDSTQVG
ncbi:MAG: hypothetical protein KF802_09205 [Bdellovibrionaceae bacterium]|nr:hypothetical protein [Pseudobdellovibrionaceae bacterium]MBX3033707.1 hypothetical protein [Pseudobdellovibrionaceae bacterium]